MKALSLIANTGIQLYTTRITFDTQEDICRYYYESVNPVNKRCSVDAVYRLEDVSSEGGTSVGTYFLLRPLVENGWLAPDQPISVELLKKNGIRPVAVDGDGQENGKIYAINAECFWKDISLLENKWLPLPYFYQRKKQNGDVIFRKLGPLNWSRIKLVPRSQENGSRSYDVVIAFETRAKDKESLSIVEQKGNEYPVFIDSSSLSADFGLCNNELLVMDFCSSQPGNSYVYDLLFRLFHPDKSDVSQLLEEDIHRFSFLTSYMYLVHLIAKMNVLPQVTLLRSSMEDSVPVDMVVSVGSDTTSALLLEDSDISAATPLRLVDFTHPIDATSEQVSLRKTEDSFSMQLVFKQAYFGNFGPNKSRQFVYPSFVRLGAEAVELLNDAMLCEKNTDTTYCSSCTKTSLWDTKPSETEWNTVALAGEDAGVQIPEIPNLSRYISSTGELSAGGIGGGVNRFSNRSLMMLSFLEMINQAYMQINSEEYRCRHGKNAQVRQLRTIIVTCSPAMLKSERDALVNCAVDASVLFGKFYELRDTKINVVPQIKRRNDASWLFDEATSAQLTYLYSEIAYKYNGRASEYSKLYQQNNAIPLTIGTVDVGAATVDTIINEYTFKETESNVSISPNPLFFDTYAITEDGLVKELIFSLFLYNEQSPLRKQLNSLSVDLYHQFIQESFVAGPLQVEDQNICNSIYTLYFKRLAQYFLLDLSKDSRDCVVTYDEVWHENPLNSSLLMKFTAYVDSWLQKKGEKECGLDLVGLEWIFDAKQVSKIVFDVYEPILKKVATLLHAYSCDVVLLNGRPSSLPSIRTIFLKYYAVSPDRLICMQNRYVGTWYPFSQNTGYVNDAKTVAPIGAMLGYMGTVTRGEKSVTFDFDQFGKQFDSSKSVQFVEGPKIGVRTNYILTPVIKQGSVVVKEFPFYMKAKQYDVDSYPTRVLYSVDVNRFKLTDKIRRQAIANGVMNMAEEDVAAQINAAVKELTEKMPLTVVLERNFIDKDSLDVSSITDANGETLTDTCIDVQICTPNKERKI